MNLGLATLLKERGILPATTRPQAPKITLNGAAPTPCTYSTVHHTPLRFGSIVTETMSGSTKSQTEVIYTTASTMMVTTHTNIPPFEGISDTAMPLIHPDTYEIVDQVLSNQLEKTASTTAAAVNILGAGLNTILPVNDKRGLVTRKDAMNQSEGRSPRSALDLKLKSKRQNKNGSPTKASPTKASVNQAASRPTYIGDLQPLSTSSPRGVLTRMGAAKLKQELSISPVEKNHPSHSPSTPKTPTPAKDGLSPICSLHTTPSNGGLALTTSTSSSNYYSSPISYACLPTIGDNRSAEDSCDKKSPLDKLADQDRLTGAPASNAGLVQTPGTAAMSESLIKHLAKIRMKRRQAGLLGALTGHRDLNTGLSSIASPPAQTPDSPGRSADLD